MKLRHIMLACVGIWYAVELFMRLLVLTLSPGAVALIYWSALVGGVHGSAMGFAMVMARTPKASALAFFSGMAALGVVALIETSGSLLGAFLLSSAAWGAIPFFAMFHSRARGF